MLGLSSCVVVAVRSVRGLRSSDDKGDIRIVAFLDGRLRCSLKTDRLNHSDAEIDLAESYVIDPEGEKRSLVVVSRNQHSKEHPTSYFANFSLTLKPKDGVKEAEPFGDGVYEFHLFMKEAGQIYEYRRSFDIQLGIGTPL